MYSGSLREYVLDPGMKRGGSYHVNHFIELRVFGCDDERCLFNSRILGIESLYSRTLWEIQIRISLLDRQRTCLNETEHNDTEYHQSPDHIPDLYLFQIIYLRFCSIILPAVSCSSASLLPLCHSAVEHPPRTPSLSDNSIHMCIGSGNYRFWCSSFRNTILS